MTLPTYVSDHLADPIRATFWCVEFAFSTPQRITNCDQPIIVGGNAYAPAVLKVEGVRLDPTDTASSSAALVVGSASATWQALLASAVDAERHPLVTIHQAYLDPATLSPTPAAVWTRLTGKVESAEWGTSEARFTIGQTADPAISRLPHREYSDRCSYRKFKGGQCGYAGAATTCDRSFETCTALGNAARFGGFRSITRKQIKITWEWEHNGVLTSPTITLLEREETK